MARSVGMEWLACAVAGAIAANSSALAQADVQPLDLRFTHRGDVLYFIADAEKAGEEAKASKESQGEYWLGVQIAELPEVAKQQLGLDQGLVVEDVMPDSPAAKAEIKKHDILIKAGDTPLKEPNDLVKSVEASKGKEMTIAIVRGGKDRTVKVVAAKRPEKERFEIRTARPQIDAEIKRLEEALESLKSKAGKDGFGLWLARPGVVAPSPKAQVEYKVSPFSEKDWSIQVTKEGEEPTKIHVKRGDKEWDVTEDKVNELPGDVRGHILALMEKTLMRGVVGATRNTIRVNPQGKVEGELRIGPYPAIPSVPFYSGVLPSPGSAPRGGVHAPNAPAPPTAPSATTRSRAFRAETGEGPSDSKLDAIMNEVKQLRKELEELRSKSPGDKK